MQRTRPTTIRSLGEPVSLAQRHLCFQFERVSLEIQPTQKGASLRQRPSGSFGGAMAVLRPYGLVMGALCF